MGYFRELPDLQYQSFLSDSDSSDKYLVVKNLFRRCKLRTDLKNVFTVFDKYEIVDGARPDTVAQELYGNSELDWVVIYSSSIVNIRNEWPLSDREIYNHAVNIYGESNLSKIHHYETKEVKDSKGIVILPAGKVVNGSEPPNNPEQFASYCNLNPNNPVCKQYDQRFKLSYTDNGVLYTNDATLLGSGAQRIDDPFIGITNLQHTIDINNKKRTIYVLKNQYLQQFLTDMRKEMQYSKSSQYVSNIVARTENTKNTIL